jgi:phage N-6-adenine-methyltransferase
MCADIAATQTSKTQDWMTPLWLFNLLDLEFSFTLDVCADKDNTLCDDWFDRDKDGLKQNWSGICFCNPPYNQAKLWVEKAYHEAEKGNCTAVLLIAARTDTRYFWSFARHGEIRFLPGRLKFDLFEGTKFSAPFPSAVVIFRQNNIEPKVVFWDIREPKHAI